MDSRQLVNYIFFPARKYNLFHFIVQEESHHKVPQFSYGISGELHQHNDPNLCQKTLWTEPGLLFVYSSTIGREKFSRRYFLGTPEIFSFCLDGRSHICYKTRRL
jgi:hypothetical protein